MIENTNIAEFRKSLHGKIIQPGDKDYKEARRVWNGMIDKHPSLIVRCSDVSDVQAAVVYARTHELLVAVRGGGHNVAGFGTCEGGIVIDLSQMKKVDVDVPAKTVRAQAGLTWGEFDSATQAHNLATTGGLVSSTGIAGFTLGGGFGWLVRKHGLTVDNLLSVDMVLANGQSLTASRSENADLFWGICGGGGNFGIVTSFQYRLHDVGPMVYSGAVFYPADKARELLQFYREWTSAMPDELSTMIAFLTAPPEPFVPKKLVGMPVIVLALCYAGSVEEGEQAVKPLRTFDQPVIDLLGPIPYLHLQTMFDATAPKGINSYWKTENFNELGGDAIRVLIEYSAKMRSLSHFTAVHMHHWGGAIKSVDTNATAFAHRDVNYVLNIIGQWNEQARADEHISWTRDFSRALQPFSTGQKYLNFLGDADNARVRAAYGETNYERLVALKNKYDPANLFRVNQNIKPSV